MSNGRLVTALGVVVLLVAGVARHRVEGASSQTATIQMIAPNSSASFTLPSGTVLSVVNQTSVPVRASMFPAPSIVNLFIDAPTGTSIMAVPGCTPTTDIVPNVLTCYYGGGETNPPNPLVVAGTYVPPTPIAEPQPSCPPVRPCMTTLNEGQTIAIDSFTVSNAPSPGGHGAFKISYDGTTLSISALGASPGVGPAGNQPPGCLQVNGVPDQIQCTNPHGTLAFTVGPPNPAGFYCYGVGVPAGWNLLSHTPAERLNLNVGPLYTYRAGDSAYEAVSAGPNLPADAGFWAFFSNPTRVFLGCSPGPIPPSVRAERNRPVSVPIGAGLTMVGNPFDLNHVTISGADAVYAYDPTSGYQATNTLQPGQGAWVYSASGGTVTVAPTAPTPASTTPSPPPSPSPIPPAR